MDRVRQIEMFDEFRQVIGISVHGVAVPGLARPALAAAVMSDAAKPCEARKNIWPSKALPRSGQP
jgi:hypothetical protein